MKLITTIILFLFSSLMFCQGSLNTSDDIFDEVAKKNKGINASMEMDVTGLTLSELISSIAEEHKINVHADTDMNQIISSNFFDLSVRDVFSFLIKKYDLELKYISNILIFKKKPKKEKKQKPKPKRKIDLVYNDKNDFLSVKLKNDTLSRITEKITELSGKNIVLAPKIKNQQISSYIVNRPFDQVLEMMGKSNGLIISKDENDFYYIEKGTEVKASKKSNSRKKGKNSKAESSGELDINLSQNGYLSIKTYEASATEIIIEAAKLLGIDYFFHKKPDDIKTTLNVSSIDFDELLSQILKGSNYTSNTQNGLYIIGEQSTEGLRTTELIQLEYRTLESVLETIPSSVKQGLEMKEFIELNGIMVSGSDRKIKELKAVIRKLDKVVPLVQIEVIIAEYRRSYDISTGLQSILAASADDVPTTNGLIAPETNATVSSSSINKIIDAFNGLGIINIGKVTENFYANLNALEQNSIIKIKSTPKIATLSGHNATVSVGETQYYFEQNNTLINSGVNDNILQSGQYKSTEANLSLSISPNVSKDEHITLEVSVEQSTFLDEGVDGAPPGKATRQFESLIRVRNNEMILLGGLDQFNKSDSGSGVPLISRIPIIKWFFSTKSKSKSKSKLHVFIKPTVIY